MTSKTTELNQYAAAHLTGMSPELLLWLTKHAPKSGENRKLKVAKRVDEVTFYTKDELLDFDAYLKTPWPAVSGKRPNIPNGIKEEIKVEANNQCAICASHSQSCEAAHIVPVSDTHNNHPANLIWLCSSHHTEYDKGVFGPLDEDLEFIPTFKARLVYFKRVLWSTQGNVLHKLFLVLNACDGIEAELAGAKTADQKKAVRRLAKEVLDDLANLAPVSKSDPKYAKWKKLETEAKALSTNTDAVAKRLKKAKIIRDEYVASFGSIVCPVCLGSGVREGDECGACAGLCEIPEAIAKQIDFDTFKKVDCPICNGSGAFKGGDCPACQGQAQIDKGDADKMDARDFSDVDCPQCNGKGIWNGEECPACHGDRQMERRYADAVNLREYDEVDCPVCNGTVHYEYEDCPACHGHQRMLRQQADTVDVREYALVNCPVCKGKPNNYDDCRCCGGQLKMMRFQANQVDLSDYK